MATLYIADDEPIIIKGLSKMVSSFNMDLEIIGTSTDGSQALDDILKLKPDILITDVQMPGKTGLELISSITSSSLLTRIIFLSGYREFSYIKHALTHDAVDYLLKPVNEEDLQRTLTKALQFLEKQNKLAYFEEVPQNQYVTAYEDTLQKFIKKKKLMSSDTAFVCVSFTVPLHVQRELRKVPFEHFELLRFSSLNFLREHCDIYKDSILLERKNNSLVYLFLLKPPQSLDSLENFLVETNEELRQRYQVIVLTGIGEKVFFPEEVNFSYTTANHAVNQYFFSEKHMNASYQLKQEFHYSFDDYNNIYNEIVDNILKRNCDMMEEFETCLSIIYNLHYSNSQSVINRVIMFVSSLRNDMEKYQLPEDSEEHYNEFVKDIQKSTTFRQLKHLFLSYYRELATICTEDSDTTEIAQIKHYLELHYQEEITLKHLADIVYMNPSYFSYYFKKCTGENYKTYLTKIRLEKSLPLLLGTNLKIYQIAEQVGYKSIKRYTSAFKSQYHCSPAEFREKNA